MTISTNKGMRGVRARYDAVLPPNISIVRHPGRPVISGMEWGIFWPFLMIFGVVVFPMAFPQDPAVLKILRVVNLRKAPDTFKFLRHVMRAIWSVRPKCSHRCVSLKETSLKPVQILKHTTFFGAGVLRKFGADFFCVFFSGFHLPDKPNVQTSFLRRFLVRRFLRPFLVCRFLRPFLRRFLVRRFLHPVLRPFLRPFSADFSSTFWRLKIGVPESRKNAQKMRGKMRGIRMALLGGAPHSLSACSSRQYATQPPLGRHTQGEHVSVHRDIFGLNYMLAFAPRFFKNKNPRRMSSAKPQPPPFTQPSKPL